MHMRAMLMIELAQAMGKENDAALAQRGGMRRDLQPVGRVLVRAEAAVGAVEVGLVERRQHLGAGLWAGAQRGLVVQEWAGDEIMATFSPATVKSSS